MQAFFDSFVASLGQRSVRAARVIHDLVRKPNFRQPRATEPLIIEIIGVAGAGKTTFLQNISRGRSRIRYWATLSELPHLDRFPHPKRIWLSDARLLEILQDKIRETQEKRGGTGTELNQLCNASNRYFRAITLQRKDLPCHLVEDEGFFLTFHKQLLRHGADDLNFLRQLARLHAFVYLRCDPELALTHLRKRAANGGKTVAHHRNLTDEALLERLRGDAACIDQLVARLRAAGRPVLELTSPTSALMNVSSFDAMFDQMVNGRSGRTLPASIGAVDAAVG